MTERVFLTSRAAAVVVVVFSSFLLLVLLLFGHYRKRNEDEDAKEKMYTLVTYVPVPTFKKLVTKAVDE
jgi:hypothetical protein